MKPSSFRKRTEIVEETFRQAILVNGADIEEYHTVDEFLKAN